MVPSDRISSSRRRPGSHPLNLTHRRDPGPFDCLAGAQDRLRRDDDSMKNGQSLASTAAAADQRIRNGGRHRCQPPLSGFALLAPFRFIPVRFSCDQRPAKRCVAAPAGAIRRRFGRPPFGGRPHLESPSSSLLASAEAVALQAMDCVSCTRSGPYQLVGIATFRDQAIGRFPRRSVRSLPASLATTLDVPVVRRLCRPMI